MKRNVLLTAKQVGFEAHKGKKKSKNAAAFMRCNL